jgi:hypothetical protein
MDEKSKAILAGFPGNREHSQLAPYRKLILELHQRGYSFKKIAPVLSENFGLNVASTIISRFVLRLEQQRSKPRKTKPRKEKPVPTLPTAPVKPTPDKIMPPSVEIRQKITAFKQQQTQSEPDRHRFDYDPDQPLHLEPE